MKRWVLVAISLALLVSLVGIASCTKGSTTPMPRELTGNERAKVIEIALNTPQVREWLGKESKYEAKLVWVAINDENPDPYEYSWMRAFEYDEIAEAAELISEWTVVYPGVSIRFGEPWQFTVQVTIDLNTGKTVDVDMWPARR